MKRARKSNRVSWASGVYLCQVKLFLSEDCPSKIGQNSLNQLQVKSSSSSMLHSNTNEFNDLPPGFEGNHLFNHLKDQVSNIPQIKWKCPRQFAFSPNWLVVAGEESREKQDQKLREMKVLEAVYPRVSAIPPSPSVYLDVEEEDYDDSLTPVIPIIPIEEEESMDIKPELGAAVDISLRVHSQTYPQCVLATTPTSSQCVVPPTPSSIACGKPSLGISSDQEADLVAASALVAAIMKSNELGSRIDMDLLVKIFNDPIMIQTLINNHRMAAITETASSNTMGLPASGLKPATISIPLSTPTPSQLLASVFPATPPVSLLMSTHDKPPAQSAPLSMPMPDKPATPAVPLSRSLPDKPAIPSVPLPTPAADRHIPMNRNLNHLSNGMQPTLNPHLPKQDTVLASGVRRATSLASISSSETSAVPLPTASVNFNEVGNQARPPVSTMSYAANTGSDFSSKEAHPVKDANYYKNLIRQHGADLPDTQVGILHSNSEDMKPVYNIKPGEVKPKMQKPCIYYNSPRGCRNGSNCPYKHDMSYQWGTGNIVGVQTAKRLKLGLEIKGRI